MERRNSGDFPSGSNGGGGKRGYGVVSTFSINGDEGASNSIAENNETRNVVINRCITANEGIGLNWLGDPNEAEGPRFNIREQDQSSTNSPDDQEHRLITDRDNDIRNDLEFVRRLIDFGLCIGFARYFGYCNTQNAFAYPGVIGAPVNGRGGVPLALGANIGIEYCGWSGGYGFRHGEIQNSGRGDLNVVAQGLELAQRFGGMYGVRRGLYDNVDDPLNGTLFYYIKAATYAHQILHGDILGRFLSLRDSHVFNIMKVTEYAGMITQMCHDPDLAEALISHIDCLRALMNSNVHLGLTKQITCVNAVMRLISEQYRREEEWTHPLIETVLYDLRVLSEKSASKGCCGRIIIQCDWAINNVVCLFHPPDCQCHLPRPRPYRTRMFYRRS